MDIKSALFQFLSGKTEANWKAPEADPRSALWTLIGKEDACKLYPLLVPTLEQAPAISFYIISDAPIRTGKGRIGGKKRVQFIAWAKTSDETSALIEALSVALDSYSGIMGGASGLEVQAALYDSVRDGYDPDRQLANESADFMIWHS
jgi:hypothetical protein